MAKAEQVGDGLKENSTSDMGLSPINHHPSVDLVEDNMVHCTYLKDKLEAMREAKAEPTKMLPLMGLEDGGHNNLETHNPDDEALLYNFLS